MSNSNTKVARLLRIRSRIIDDIKHHMSVVDEFNDDTMQSILKNRKRSLISSYKEFTDNWIALENCQDAKSEFDAVNLNVQNNSLKDEYLTTVSTIEDFEVVVIPAHNSTHVDGTMNQANNSNLQNSSFASQIKLPPIKLQTFNGDFDDWEEFRDTFQACFTTLNNEREISDCQKFLYLKGVLGKEPLLLIKNLRATNENYRAAWDVLEKRYNNKRRIIYTHYRTILDLPIMEHESAESLRKMLDTLNSSIAAIKIHNPILGQLDPFIVFLLSQKFDRDSRKHWEEHLKAATDLPTLETFKTFLDTRFNILDGIDSSQPSKPFDKNTKSNFEHRKGKPKPEKTFLNTEAKVYKCPICSADHRPYHCPQFVPLNILQRRQFIADRGLCGNCLYSHGNTECKSKYTCRKCNQKHHSTLHEEVATSSNIDRDGVQIHHVSHTPSVLLATARIRIKTPSGVYVNLRAMLDQGSSTNLITTTAANLIKSKFVSIETPLLSIGNTQTACAQHKVAFTLGSIYSNFELKTNALVIPAITSFNTIPYQTVNHWNHLAGIELADPQFHQGGHIDVLLGVETYSDILLTGLKKGPKNTPIAQNTKLGWILSGSISFITKNHPTCMFTTADLDTLNTQIKRFWQLDEIDDSKPLHTVEETACEDHFAKTTTRIDDGRYMVRLPFKVESDSSNFLGNSYENALKRLYATERKLNNNDKLKQAYHEYIQEYIDLKHIQIASVDQLKDMKNSYFMPHHAVWKESSTTTKLRVVFDASCKSSNGFSLNERLMVGPTIQSDLFTLLLRWRQFPIAFSADITKMYRQFWVHPDDAKFQRILWRVNGEVKQFLSHTITFGTSSAPYQAIRLLHHIADEIQTEAPLAADLLKNHFYVDDCVGGAQSVEEAIEKYQQLNTALEERGLQLRKWTSNSKKLLEAIPDEYQENSKPIQLPDEQMVKSLGIYWHPTTDIFSYSINLPEPKSINTKRSYLSEFATLFDPLGWLAPCMVIPKILLQHIWIKGINWDDPLPEQINNSWCNLRDQFKILADVRIPRWNGMAQDAKHISIHGFADASESAIAAVVYLRTEHRDNSISSIILSAKTKVAPIKKISLPRLELNAAHLLTKLIAKIQGSFSDKVEICAYTDSTITLSWISSHPSKWKTYVANRITIIQEIVPTENWYHIRSKENPADCASRGIFPHELVNHNLWWHGPSYLLTNRLEWTIKRYQNTDQISVPTEERKQYKLCFQLQDQDNDLLNRFSSMYKLLKITSYCFRWLHRTGKQQTSKEISTEEIEQARKHWIRLIQWQHFKLEMSSLSKRAAINSKSKLLPLAPFFDEHQIMRVRGRIQNAEDIPFDQKFPVILPDKGHFTWLVIEDAHKKTFHGGTQLVIQYTRHKYWILNARNTIRRQIWKCVRCFRYRKITSTQMMGALPSPRVTPCTPFLHSGVDFAGYFEVKSSTLRQAPYVKCYISLFVCLSTKAIHLELVEDLSTEAFIAAFRRFAARRGIPAHMYSDHGTNFVGASNQLPKLLTNILSTQRHEVAESLKKDGTQWHMIPPHSPHFGGLWEAGVKSTKHHLKRVLGETRVKAAIFNTILTQIEAVLNSRPLCQLTADPEDVSYLTPGHFLIGRPLALIPSPDVRLIVENRLDLYQLGQKIVQQFWHQWSAEYLQRLQTRPKWAQSSPNMELDQIVLIKEDNLPPGKWMLGKVVKTISGSDGLVRVVELRCNNTILRRPVHKVCILPTTDNNPADQPKLDSS